MIITLATSQNPLKKVVGSLMGLNCPKLIVIVSETLKDLDKELHIGGGPDCSPLLPQEYRRI
jgi:hypothetical protein